MTSVTAKYNSAGVTLTDQQQTDLQLDGSGFLKVNVAAGSGGTPTGTAGTPNTSVVTVQGIAGATPQPVSIDQTTPGTTNAVVATGNVASASADSGNPVKIGGLYTSGALSAVATGQRTNLTTDQYGNVRASLTGTYQSVTTAIEGNPGLIAAQNPANAGNYAPLATLGHIIDRTNSNNYVMSGDKNGIAVQPAQSGYFWNYAAASGGIANTTTAVTVKAAAGASVRNYVMSMQVNTATLGAATELAIRDGAAGTVLWRGQLQTTALPVTTINFDPPLKGTANTLVEVVTLTAVTGAVYVNMQGYTGV